MLQIQAQFIECVSAVYCRYRRSLLQIQVQFVALHPMLLSSLRVRHPIRFRSPPNQIPSATQSDSVRHPIRFRSPPDQIPSAARSDSVRHPIRFRPPPVGGYGILPYPRSPLRDPPCCPHRGCSGLRCTNQAINQPNTQPTTNQPTTKQPNNQAINQPNNQAPI